MSDIQCHPVLNQAQSGECDCGEAIVYYLQYKSKLTGEWGRLFDMTSSRESAVRGVATCRRRNPNVEYRILKLTEVKE